MNNSVTKALLFVIALSTSIMAVQLIPISRKVYLFNLCRDYNVWWNESYYLADDLVKGNKDKDKDKDKEEKYSKAIKKSNYYLQKIYKELGINSQLHGQEAPYTYCERIGFDWFVDLTD